MTSYEEFEGVGKKPGLEVWRINNFKLEVVPKELHGSFYTGDTYLLLRTTSAPSFSIHIWIGDDCSLDERGSVAIFATQLDDHLGGGPVQYREVQNYESMAFQGYFKKGIKYQRGGVASGFSKVVPNQTNVKRLLHVKGRRFIRATEVELSWSSFNKGDTFIMEVDKDIFLWYGSECNRYERLKATQLGIDIRDNERNARSELHFVDEGDEPEAFIEVLGPKPDIAPASDDDTKVEVSNRGKAALYMISNVSGSMKTSEVAPSSPFEQAMLSLDECYILDDGADRKIFVWKGPNANKSEREAALSAGEKFITEKNYPRNTQIEVLPAGGETPLFKQFFSDWKDKDEIAAPSNVPRLFGCSNKTGRLKVEQVPGEFTQADLATDDVMLLDAVDKIFVWVGNDANEAEKTGAEEIAKKYIDHDVSSRKETPITTIKQGEEPSTFTDWFKAWNPNMWDTDPMEQIRARFGN